MRHSLVRLGLQRWSFQSVEWNSAMTAVPPTWHAVLPHLPSTTPALQKSFVESLVYEQRIITVAACDYSPEGLVEWARIQPSRHLLVVGGNEQTSTSLRTAAALQILREAQPEATLWATANPNSRRSIESVHRKQEAGATGIVLQPILSSRAPAILENYPKDHIKYVAGLAFPQSVANLHRWESLLEQPADEALAKDAWFRGHCDYFANHSKPPSATRACQWALDHVHLLASLDPLTGIHCMPLRNTPTFLAFLESWKD